MIMLTLLLVNTKESITLKIIFLFEPQAFFCQTGEIDGRLKPMENE